MTSVFCSKFRTPRMSKETVFFHSQSETSCHGEPQKKMYTRTCVIKPLLFYVVGV